MMIDEVNLAVVQLIEPLDCRRIAQIRETEQPPRQPIVSAVSFARMRPSLEQIVLRRRIIWRMRLEIENEQKERLSPLPAEPLERALVDRRRMVIELIRNPLGNIWRAMLSLHIQIESPLRQILASHTVIDERRCLISAVSEQLRER